MSGRTWGKVNNNIKRDESEFPSLNASESSTHNEHKEEHKTPLVTTGSRVSLENLNLVIAPDEYIFTPTAELLPTCTARDCQHYFRFARSSIHMLFPDDGRVKATCQLMEEFDRGRSIIELTIPCALFCVLSEYANGLREYLPSIYTSGGMNSFIPPICRQFGGTNVAYLTTYLGLDIHLCYDASRSSDDDIYDTYNMPQDNYSTRQDILNVLPRDICNTCLKQENACECDEPYMMDNCCNKKICKCDVATSSYDNYYKDYDSDY